jgi:DNA-binding transcriptional MerR regulator
MIGFSPSFASRVSGLSTWMIGYLCREGFVAPIVSNKGVRGKQRRFSYSDLLVMRTLALLLKRGVEIKRLRESLDVLRRKYPQLSPTELPFRFLVTDGNQIFESVSTDHVLRLDYSAQYEFCFVIDLAPIEREIQAQIRKSGRAA